MANRSNGIHMRPAVKTLVLCSGCLDSVTLAYLMRRDPVRELSRLVSVDYWRTQA